MNSILKMILIFFAWQSFGQTQESLNNNNHLRNLLVQADMRQASQKSETLRYSNIEGSPFMHKEYQLGDIYTTQGVFRAVKMKYDIFEDSFQFNMDNRTLYLDPSDYVKKIVIGSDVFVVRSIPNVKKKDNYLIELDSSKVSLYSKKNVIFKKEELAKALESRPTPATFLARANKYYLQIGSSNLVQIEKIKDVYELFPDEAEALKKYIKAEDLDFKKEADLIKIVRFCGSKV